MTDFEEKALFAVMLAAGGYIVYKNLISVSLNPANPDNVVNQAATSLYHTVTGSTGSIGGDLYDLLHPAPTPPTSATLPVYPVNQPGQYDSWGQL